MKPGGSLRSVYELITAFTTDAKFTPGMAMVVDARGGDYTPTVPDLICLGKIIGDMKGNFAGNIAIIAESAGLKFAIGLLCATARAEGFKMRSFTDPEAAEEWARPASGSIPPSKPDDAQ